MPALGLDVGTTGLKGLLVDDEARVIATAERSYPSSSPAPGWSEQDPDHWWRAAADVARELSEQGRVDAVGLSGQMHGSVFLDDAGEVLRPAILWNDQRSGEECEEILRLTGGRVVDWTLNPPRTAFTATKILWVRHHQPEILARTGSVLLPKDHVRFRLSGERFTDVSDASGTCLLDVAARAWSQSMLEALDVPQDWLPEVVESAAPAGSISAEAARATGLVPGTPIVGGAADQAAAALGNGIAAPGRLSITLGTSGVVYAQLDRLVVDPSGAFHTFCHSVLGTWQVMAGVLSAGGSLQWYRDRLDPHATFESLVAGAREIPPGSAGLVFLPYLTGERSPHADPDARGAFFGLTARHDRRHMARAVMEGVAYALRDLVDIVERLGVELGEIRVAGGGSRGALWLEILADVLGRELRPALTADASAYGAALLALAHASGREVGPLAMESSRTGAPVAPDPARRDAYSRAYEVFRALYPTTRALMHDLAHLDRTTAEGATP